MTKDTDAVDAAMEAYEAWVRSNVPFTMTGLLSNDIFIAGYDAGYDARDAVTCEWRWKEKPSSNEEGWGTRCQKFLWDGDKPKFCPNCGGRVKEAK